MFNRRFLYATLASTLAILFHAKALAQLEDRTEAVKEITALRKKLNEKEKLFPSPSAEDQAKFAEFLKQPGTGLIRLYPRGLYKDRLITFDGGSYYSFSSSPLVMRDIELATSQMWPEQSLSAWGESSSGSLFEDRPEIESRRVSSSRIDPNPLPSEQYKRPRTMNYYIRPYPYYGFIVMLGKIPLEKVTLDQGGVKFLAAIDPPPTETAARAVFQSNNKAGNDKYRDKKEALVSVNQTYAIRSIHYGRSDILVALRVVRMEKDGSVIILWKTLKEFPAPTLAR
jgi:hypothetical protein